MKPTNMQAPDIHKLDSYVLLNSGHLVNYFLCMRVEQLSHKCYNRCSQASYISQMLAVIKYPFKVVFYLMTSFLSLFPVEDAAISNSRFLNSGSILDLNNSYTGSFGWLFSKAQESLQCKT